jgi:HAD superfamily hydrolase (TIGR01484 family)
VSAARPAPLAEMPALPLEGLLTDIDDTLTTAGRLRASALRALERLHDAGLRIVPVTGRSAGWAHMILKTWPVDAVVAESGGLYLARGGDGRLREVLHAPREEVARGRAGVLAVARELLATHPSLAEASDNAYRRVDVALDWCEEVDPAAPEVVEAAIARLRDAGFSARASSVHVNAWQGSFDKAPMALRCLRELWGIDEPAAQARWLFVGDAPNDASMFERFPLSVGVANIAPALPRLPTPPAWITRAGHGEGFEELAGRLLAARGR